MIWASPFRFARRFLGVKDTDPEFPPIAFTDSATSVIDRLQQDCAQMAENLLLTSATIAPDDANGRTYTGAAQAVPVTNMMRVMLARLDNSSGIDLDEIPRSQLDQMRGLSYALMGPESARVIEVSEGVPAGRPLFLRYIPSPAAVLGETDTVPPFVPDQYADLLGHMIAEMMWPQGGEAQMPRDQSERMEDRLGQLYERWAKATPTPLRRRMTGDGEAPYLF